MGCMDRNLEKTSASDYGTCMEPFALLALVSALRPVRFLPAGPALLPGPPGFGFQPDFAPERGPEPPVRAGRAGPRNRRPPGLLGLVLGARHRLRLARAGGERPREAAFSAKWAGCAGTVGTCPDSAETVWPGTIESGVINTGFVVAWVIKPGPVRSGTLRFGAGPITRSCGPGSIEWGRWRLAAGLRELG